MEKEKLQTRKIIGCAALSRDSVCQSQSQILSKDGSSIDVELLEPKGLTCEESDAVVLWKDSMLR